LRSHSGEKTTLVIRNETNEEFKIFWIDYEGNLKPYGVVWPKMCADENTYATHAWALVDSNGVTRYSFAASEHPCFVVVR